MIYFLKRLNASGRIFDQVQEKYDSFRSFIFNALVHTQKCAGHKPLLKAIVINIS